MALAVTHVLVTIVILDLFRHYVTGKKSFPRYLLVIGGIAGLAPDIDIPLEWIGWLITGNTVNLHGLFTHSIFFSLLFFIIGGIFHYYKNLKWAKIFYVIGVGWTFHIFFDCFFGGEPSKLFIWPFQLMPTFCPKWNLYDFAHSIDAIILVLWIAHEEIHNRIKDYI